MSIEKARDHYLGKNGVQKANCAQSVIYAFKEKYDLPQQLVADMASCGGGRAPDGVCGALYAATKVAGDARQKCEEALSIKAGSIKCREIRSLGKLSCVGCVETIAGSLDKC
jgi:hypothetical protein